jgi:hypothetical protein
MATRGRPLGLKKYSLEVMGANYAQLYKRIVLEGLWSADIFPVRKGNLETLSLAGYNSILSKKRLAFEGILKQALSSPPRVRDQDFPKPAGD